MIRMTMQLSDELFEMIRLGLSSGKPMWMLFYAVALVLVLLLHVPLAAFYTAWIGRQFGLLGAYVRIWFSLLVNLRASPGAWKLLDGAWLCLWVIAHLPAVCWLGLLYWFVMAWEIR
jgi:hypothetical protein